MARGVPTSNTAHSLPSQLLSIFEGARKGLCCKKHPALFLLAYMPKITHIISGVSTYFGFVANF